MATAEALLAAGRGLVVAPAGCGKTHLLSCTVLAGGGGRVLVLTHTRAGVAVIRNRLTGARNARIATLDNWAAWLAVSFPGMSGYVPTFTSRDYRAAREAAVALLAVPAIRGLVASTWDLVLVDEYQDCDSLQHRLVLALAEAVPTVAFGDPMQRVFDFGGNKLPDWPEVLEAFDTNWMLDTPWRWANAGERRFGEWLLEQRTALEAGRGVNFLSSPSNVRWLELPDDPGQHLKARLDAIPHPARDASLLVMNRAQDAERRRQLARHSVSLSVVERADLSDLTDWASAFDRAIGHARAGRLVDFAHDVMTGVDAKAMKERLASLARGSARKPATDEEKMLLGLADGAGEEGVASALKQLAAGKGRSVFRHDLLDSFRDAARLASADPGRGLAAAAKRVLEKRSEAGRRVERRAIGSTLLLKGLEADHAVVLDADGMKPADLYVAISRASRSLTVLSHSPVLGSQPRRVLADVERQANLLI